VVFQRAGINPLAHRRGPADFDEALGIMTDPHGRADCRQVEIGKQVAGVRFEPGPQGGKRRAPGTGADDDKLLWHSRPLERIDYLLETAGGPSARPSPPAAQV
jgi:hypothetical protein